MGDKSQNSAEQWRARGEFKTVLGHSIFVIDEGAQDLPTILLLHGFPTSSWDWQPIWSELTKQYRLVALDMLGFGFSDKPNSRDYSIHSQADIVEALVDVMQLDLFHVLAHDYGDTVAQELLARQLEGSGAGNWRSCCFLNGGLFPETHQALLTQRLLLSPIGWLVNRLAGYKGFCRSFSSVFGDETKPTDQELQTFWYIINLNNGKHIFHNLMTYMNDRIQHRGRWVSALQKSPTALAIINGSVDPVSGAHMVERYEQLGCRLDYLAQLPLIGHYPQVEAPDQVLGHYHNFLKLVC
tara:strand:+ start:1403 stop:2293 length:891 start_codon:yes stop_codon:yes gene_type:complete